MHVGMGKLTEILKWPWLETDITCYQLAVGKQYAGVKLVNDDT